jgi:tetratricopeptide (TPR) repeat protein
MVKMDTLILLGAMLLAYGGIILLYYRMRANERKNRISNLMVKGTMNMRRGSLERSLFYFNKAYEYSINNDNKADAAEALYNIGHIYKEKHEISTAMEYWEEADSLYLEIDDNKGKERMKTALKSITG